MNTKILINIDVDNLEKAIAFYQTALDLQPGRRFGDWGAEMLGGTSPLYLLAKKAGSPASKKLNQRRNYRRHWTPIHLDFMVADIVVAVEKAQRAGAVLEKTVQKHRWGTIAPMADPFGHGFCLIQFVGKGYDELL